MKIDKKADYTLACLFAETHRKVRQLCQPLVYHFSAAISIENKYSSTVFCYFNIFFPILQAVLQY
ncbi:MAG TPA: hypothetical protein DDY98_07120 [Ruminococcaceae bacterium]|nr:hypothetical protein [Oscillospiraceae bacterium]